MSGKINKLHFLNNMFSNIIWFNYKFSFYILIFSILVYCDYITNVYITAINSNISVLLLSFPRYQRIVCNFYIFKNIFI